LSVLLFGDHNIAFLLSPAQIIDGKFILALPEDEYYREKVEKTMPAFRKLGVIVYFVTEKDFVIIE